MPDMEKVTYGLRCMCYGDVECKECPYARNGSGWHDCRSNCAKDAIALLKEQEATKPEEALMSFYKAARLFHCGNCHEMIVENQKYCHECGRPVKWE